MPSEFGMKSVKLEEAWLADAKRIKAHVAETIAATNYVTQRFDADTDQYGWLGERAFYRFLETTYPKIAARANWVNANAETFGEYDFELDGLTFDVRAALPRCSREEIYGKLARWHYLYPATQHPNRKTYIVLTYVWPSNLDALIVGIVAGAAVARIPIRVESVRSARQVFEIPNHSIDPILTSFEDIDAVLGPIESAL